jgi:hypothetical protein
MTALTISRRRAITLLEILIVFVVFALIAAILYPVLSRAKNYAARATTLNNLRQCGLALKLYESDFGDLPRYDVAKRAIPSEVTCDRADYWRRDCNSETAAPLIGSYAYVRGLEMVFDEKDWLEYRELEGLNIMACIFHSNFRIIRFSGEKPPSKACMVTDARCAFPDVVQLLKADTSVQTKRFQTPTLTESGYSGSGITWSNVLRPR